MATRSEAILAIRDEFTDISQVTIDDRSAWLRQAEQVRKDAARLLRERFARDLEAAQFVASRNPEAFASEVKYADKLTADYLAESEKLLALIDRLAQRGLLPNNRT